MFQLLFLFLISRSLFLLLMDELSRAVAQFYPALGGSASMGGMNGGFNPPPAPDPFSGFATASHEADPSVSESKSFEQEKQSLYRLRQENLLRLNENAKLLQQIEAGLRRLEDDFEIIKARDAQRDAAARLQKEELHKLEVEFVQMFWKNIS